MADREPEREQERLATVRPDPRPAADHAGHDRWLVVRWTTDPIDLTSAETEQARALLAACTDCAALSADLTVISHATAASVVPARPRDFRLNQEQAASARGSVLDRLRRWFASPGTFALRPLAGAALTIGLLLVVVGPSLRPTVSTVGDGGTGGDAQLVPPTTTDATQATKATVVPEGPNGAGPEMFATPPSGDPATQADMTMMRVSSPSPAAETGTAAAQGAESSAPDEDGAVAERDQGAPPATTSHTSMDDTTFALTLLGIVLAGVGLMVLVFSWLARRWQDPLLR